MASQTHSPFAALSHVLEGLDADGRSVHRTEASTEAAAPGSLCATVDVAVPLPLTAEAGFAPQSAELTDDGLGVTFRRPTFVETVADRSPDGLPVDVRQTDVAIEGDDLLVTLDVVIGETAAEHEAASAEQFSGTAPEHEATAPPEAATNEAASVDSSAPSTSGSSTSESSGPGSAGSDSGNGQSASPSSLSSVAAAESAVETADGSERGSELSSDAGERSGPDSSLEDVRDESVPPYEDTAYLRRLYETCDTFAAMSDRIVMDVSAETVRRYTIDAGVHTPTSYETDESDPDSEGDDGAASEARASDSRGDITDAATDGAATGADPDEPTPETASVESDPLPDEQLLADGTGLPDELTLQDVVDAVVDARTVYEVQRQLGLSGGRTRRLLRQLNVLDLVLRRVSDDPERRISYDTVAARIRQCAPDSA